MNGNGEMKASRIGITLSVEEFNELVKLIPKIQDSIVRYKLQEIGPSPPPPLPVLPPPIIDLEKILTDLGPKEKLERYHQDLDVDEHLYGPTIDRETRVIEHDDPVNLPSLGNIDDDSQKKRKEKRKRSKESARNVNKKLKIESGIFVGYCETAPKLKVMEKKEKKNEVVKKECIDEVDSVESMKEVERKLWLAHYDMLSEKLMEVVREKCTGCQTNEPNPLGHELCIMSNSSSEEQVNLCFGEVYKHVIWDKVLDNWYKKVLEMPINLNPETLVIFRDTDNPQRINVQKIDSGNGCLNL